MTPNQTTALTMLLNAFDVPADKRNAALAVLTDGMVTRRGAGGSLVDLAAVMAAARKMETKGEL